MPPLPMPVCIATNAGTTYSFSSGAKRRDCDWLLWEEDPMLAILALHHPLTQAEYFPIDAFGNDAFIVPVFLCVLATGPGAAA